MTEEKDVRNEKSNEILMIKNYFLRKLEKAEKLLEPVEGFVFGGGIPSPVDTKQAYDLLLFVYQRMPGFFMGENVFLWEKLGWAYHLLGDIKKARQCLLIQAELQPGCADAYLNLAGFYDSRAMYTLAVKTCLDGLAGGIQQGLDYDLPLSFKRCSFSAMRFSLLLVSSGSSSRVMLSQLPSLAPSGSRLLGRLTMISSSPTSRTA